MKYIKTYETLVKHTYEGRIKPKIGDYVICKDNFFTYRDDNMVDYYHDFLENNIGLIIGKEEIDYDRFIVKFDNIPEKISGFFDVDGCTYFYKNDIIHFSPDEEKLELIISTNIYNL